MTNNTLILEIGHMTFPVNTRITRCNVNGQISITTKMASAIVVDKILNNDQEEFAKIRGQQLHTYWCSIADKLFNLGYQTAVNESNK